VVKKQFMVVSGAPLVENIGFESFLSTHTTGIRPKTLKHVKCIKANDTSLDHNALSFKRRTIILKDYQRIWRRRGIHIFHPMIFIFIRKPFFSIILWLYHLYALLVVGNKNIGGGET
jgi:hypothetical protein